MINIDVVLLSLGLVFSISYAFIMGANDAANSSAQPIGSGVMKLKTALISFAIAAAIGALIQGHMVMITIGKGIVSNVSILGAFSSSLGALIWVLLATLLKLPVSTSHSIVSAVLGYGLAGLILSKAMDINWKLVIKIILSWIVSPACCIASAYLLCKALRRIRSTKVLKGLIIAGHVFGAYSFGANDIANATGIYVTVASQVWGTPDPTTMIILAAIGSIGIALGGFTLGYRVIETVGYRIVRLDLPTAAAGILTYAFIVWLFTTVPKLLIGYGMPISTTYAAVSALIGAGLATYGFSGVSWRTFVTIFCAWVFTLPAAAGITMILYFILSSTLKCLGFQVIT